MNEPKPMHPAVAQLYRYFQEWPARENFEELGVLYHSLAFEIAQAAPDNPETTVALRKLLESRDCAMRAAGHV